MSVFRDGNNALAQICVIWPNTGRETQAENVQGEDQKKLDVLANNAFIECLSNCGTVCAMVSEEDDGHLTVEEWQKEGKYVVAFDPLDGSSNIDCNVSIGSIFGIWERETPVGTPTSQTESVRYSQRAGRTPRAHAITPPYRRTCCARAATWCARATCCTARRTCWCCT